MIAQGDKCYVQSFLKKHYGICTGLWPDGRLWFVHNRPDGGVVHTPREGFAGDAEIHVEQRARPSQGAAVAQRALDLVGRSYDLLGFNCEHAANLAANGAAESKQVRNVVATGIGFAFLAWVNQNGTSVDRSGYRRDGSGRFASRRWW
jgi:hypothetical protein